MPPYLVNAAPSIDAGWLTNPDPDIYSSWEEFAKQLFWDWQLGEAFVLATARYSTGWPARFHVVPPWSVNVEMDAGFAATRSAASTSPATSSTSATRARSMTPTATGRSRPAAAVVAAGVLGRYAGLADRHHPAVSLLEAPEEMSPDQAETLAQRLGDAADSRTPASRPSCRAA